MKETVGQRIKRRRLELNMTQAELASKMNYKHKSSIGKVENGNADITQTKVVEFAHALDTTTAYIMGWDTEEALRTAAHDKIFYDKLNPLIEQMSDIQRDALLSYASFLVSKDNLHKG
jgi:transcriptional regulator with XRE-family HTH domain